MYSEYLKYIDGTALQEVETFVKETGEGQEYEDFGKVSEEEGRGGRGQRGGRGKGGKGEGREGEEEVREGEGTRGIYHNSITLINDEQWGVSLC